MAIVPGLPTCAPRLSRLSMLDRMRMPPCLLGLLAALAGPAAAEEKPGEKLVAFKAARIHPVSGPAVAPGILVVRGKLVEAVLPGSESPPAGAEVVDLGDAVVLPGLVNPLSAISEGNYRRGGVGNLPSAGAGAPRDARGHVALSSLKPDDTVHRRLARTGYAALGWLPDPSGFLAGQASVLRPRAGREKDAAALSLKDSAYLLMSFELGKRWRDAVEGELRKAAEAIAKEAKEAEEKKKAAEKKPEEKKPDDKKPEEKKPEEKKDEKKDEKKPEEKPQPKPGEKKDAPQAPQPAQPPQAPAPPQPPRPPDPLVRALKGEVPLVVRVRSPAALDHFFRLLVALSLKPRFVLVRAPQAPATVERLARRRDRIEAVVLEARVETVDDSSVLSSAAR
ncbi:MAG: hypothetical protein HY721_15275, partial [Planctomycetes bacterium]|nr:hypothetical protein [Planctomycetota bacterium]